MGEPLSLSQVFVLLFVFYFLILIALVVGVGLDYVVCVFWSPFLYFVPLIILIFSSILLDCAGFSGVLGLFLWCL